jgi:flagellar basal body-associated protein FliL
MNQIQTQSSPASSFKMSSSDKHQDKKFDEDLDFTPAEMAAGPASANEHLSSAWPLPPYPGHKSYEMRNIAPRAPLQAATQGQAGPNPREPFGMSFFKSRKDASRKYFIALIIFLTITIVTLATVFSMLLSHVHQHERVPQNITITITTTLLSTQIEMQPITATQNSTTTQTSTSTTTSSLPNPTSVSKCWDLLNNICANTTQVPADTDTGDFGDCVPMFGFFYCGVIQQFEKEHLFIIPADDSPFCSGMRAFCNTIDVGVTGSATKIVKAGADGITQVIPSMVRGVSVARRAMEAIVTQV